MTNFENGYLALTQALRGGIPVPALYQSEVDLSPGFSSSANKKMQANPALALSGLNQNRPATYSPVIDWIQTYAPASNPLMQNESFTSHSYRPPITTGTLVLAGIAHETHEDALRDTLLARARADIAWIVLGVGPCVAKKVTNHYLMDQGVPHLFVGDGAPDTVIGINLPTFAQAGKRSHVRQGGTGDHWGPIEGTNNSALGALVAQAIGASSPAAFRELFGLICHRWPDLPPYGLSAGDVGIFKAFIADPMNISLAQAVFAMAKDFRPMLPFDFVRYEDGSIETFGRDFDGSSTGAKAVDTILANGTHYIGSADNGHRNPPNVQPQTVTETSGWLACQWKSGGTVIRVPRPTAKELYRVVTTKDSAKFMMMGIEAPFTFVPPGPPAPVPPIPTPKPKKSWFNFS